MILNVAFVVAIAVATTASTTGITHDKNGMMEETSTLRPKKILAHNYNKYIKASIGAEEEEPNSLFVVTLLICAIFSIMIFLLIFHSSWCCKIDRLNGPRRGSNAHQTASSTVSSTIQTPSPTSPQIPPPPYHLFAPPISPQSPPPPYHLFAPPTTPQSPPPRYHLFAPPTSPQSPPPPYNLFAPPSYEDIASGRINCPVLIVPVHTAHSG